MADATAVNVNDGKFFNPKAMAAPVQYEKPAHEQFRVKGVRAYQDVASIVHADRDEMVDVGVGALAWSVLRDVFGFVPKLVTNPTNGRLEQERPSEQNRKPQNLRVMLNASQQRKQFVQSCLGGYTDRMQALAATVGKFLVCSTCRDENGEPNCTHHISAVYEAQVALESLLEYVEQDIEASK